MILEIVVTHWTEPWELVQKGFLMLASQRLVDWSKVKVTLIHDGTPCYPDEYFEAFCPFKVHQISLEHRGIAAVRNYAIEHSTAEWMKFNDCDDTFASLYSLFRIMDALKGAQKYDLLWFDVYAEVDNIVHIKDDRDPVVIHGKLFRRSFLNEHELRFPEFLTWCEDSAFLAVMEMEIDHQKIGRIVTKDPIYAWIARNGSLCNRPEIRFKNLQSFFDRHCFVADEFKKRNLTDQYNTMCVRVMCDSYYTLCRVPGIEEDKSAHEARVWTWYSEHKDAIDACRPEMFDMVIEAVNKECNDGGWMSKHDVQNWIRKHERSVE